MEDDEPCAKRKKQMSGKEIIEKLESNENDVKKAVCLRRRRNVARLLF